MDLRLHPKQSEAFTSPATEILYGGAAGGGKSYLLRTAALAWSTAIPGLQVYLFRRISSDLIKNHMEGPTGFPALLAEWLNNKTATINYSHNYIAFQNGSRIFLCHCQHEKDVIKYQGADIHLLLMDELTHFTEYMYRYLRGRVRMAGLKVPEEYAARFPRIICGSNPGGIGHNWVKGTFINGADPMELRQMPGKDGGMLRQFIPARLDDNPSLNQADPEYIERLEGLGRPDLVKALRDGDWNIVAGGAFDDLWGDHLIVPRFSVPEGWRLDRTLDWGSTHPFSVGWWAEANGEEAALLDGGTFCPARGSLIRILEWYGTDQIGSNKGLRLSAVDIAKGIKEREAALVAGGWIRGPVKPGPADNQIGNTIDSGTDSIAASMGKHGVRWTESNKKPGSRIVGLQLVRDRMTAAKTGEGPGLYFMSNCRASRQILPTLPLDERNPEDVDTHAEDHIFDELRYRVLAGNNRMATSLQIRMPN